MSGRVPALCALCLECSPLHLHQGEGHRPWHLCFTMTSAGSPPVSPESLRLLPRPPRVVSLSRHSSICISTFSLCSNISSAKEIRSFLLCVPGHLNGVCRRKVLGEGTHGRSRPVQTLQGYESGPRGDTRAQGPKPRSLCPPLACPRPEVMMFTACSPTTSVLSLFRDPSPLCLNLLSSSANLGFWSPGIGALSHMN